MPDQPASSRRRTDAVALTLLLCGLLLGVILLSEPPDNRSGLGGLFPSFLGLPAEALREELTETLGVGAYALVIGWIALAAALFAKPSWLHWSGRTVGALLLVICVSVAADWIGPNRLGGPLSGSGGAVGACLGIWLEMRFHPIGAGIIFGVVTLLGLTLAAERMVTATLRGCVQAASAVGRSLRSAGKPQPVAQPEQTQVQIQHPPKREVAPPMPLPEANAAVIAITRGTEIPTDAKSPPRPFELPSLDMLEDSQPFPHEKHDEQLREVAVALEKIFKDFGLTVRVVGIHTGPVITQFEIALETGLRVAKVTALADDLALGLKVPSVRIVAPLPGRNTVGVEVPNEHRAVVRMKEIMIAGAQKIAKSKLPLFLGKDTEGRPLIYDLAEMPHLLIAGRTGTGKSVCLNSIILSLLLTRRPDECKLLMIDPKQVELAEYAKLPHLMHPVVTDNSKAEAILSWAVNKMEERYEILRRARVRNIGSYNELRYDEILRRVRPVDEKEKERVQPRMPYIVIVVDEVGDLMMAMKKEVEGHIIRLAQKSRAAGIHLILTTQRPTVDVITGLIKSNLPARICFQVADRSNSRVVLDEMGAEKLLGKGDMLFLQPSTSTISRAQGTYASDAEISRIVAKLEVENPEFDSELLNLQEKDDEDKESIADKLRQRDDLYEPAVAIVVREGRGSVSLLQRALGIGYGKAARFIDWMAEDGIVGHYNGAQAREVLVTPEQWEQMKDDGRGLRESA